MNWIAFTLCLVICGCRDGSGTPARSAFVDTAARSSVADASNPDDAAIGSNAQVGPDAAVGPLAAPPALATDWCIDKVNALDQGACYVLPDKPTRTLETTETSGHNGALPRP